MITIDELIEEGKSFEIKSTGFTDGFEAGCHVIYSPTKYISNGDQYYEWIAKAKRFLQIHYPNDIATNDFSRISEQEVSEKNIFALVAILVSLKEMPELCEYKETEEMGGHTININQNQHQAQTQSQSQSFELFMDAIKDHLTLGQFQELQKIVKETPNAEEARPKIIDKLKSFGESVLSGILTNIITNPTIWGGLF